MSSDISHRIPLTGERRSLGGKISGGRGRPPANILIPLEGQLNALQLAADSFYIMKLCSRLFVVNSRSRPKYDNSRHLIPILRKLGAAYRTLVDGSLESPCRVLVKPNRTSSSISYS